MLPQRVTTISLDSFHQRSQGKKVVLLYPWTNYRNLFLTYFYARSREGLLYYRIPDDSPALKSWLAGFIQEVADVTEKADFGSTTRKAINETSDPLRIGEALASDLKQFGNQQIILYFDEFDKASNDDEFRRFIVALVNNLPKNAQLAFSSRLLTYEPWYSMVAKGEAVVLGTEHRKNDVMFNVEENPRPQLEVYALGRGHALVNGAQITNWDGALPRNLFFYFLDRPLVTRDEIFETFWPELSVKEATNVFHVTKRKISERISMKVNTPGSYELTQYNGGFYLPSEKIVRHYDVADFQEAIERALVARDEREEETLLRRAINSYKASFLQNIDMAWTRNRRDHLRQLNAQALISMGRLMRRRDDDAAALGFYLRALREAPEREDIHREVMSIYYNMGKYDDARIQYEIVQKLLHESLKIEPARETRELYDLIKARL